MRGRGVMTQSWLYGDPPKREIRRLIGEKRMYDINYGYSRRQGWFSKRNIWKTIVIALV